jgi:hypothetical protein
MPINTVRNNAGYILTLWDIGIELANINNNQAIHNVPITITSVTLNNVHYFNKNGNFQPNDSYTATFIQGNPPISSTVLFTGNEGNVTFR